MDRDGLERDQATRLQLALADHLDTAFRLAWYVGDDDASDDELVACVAALAHDASEIVPPGRERAWVLRTLLDLLGASVPAEAEERQRELPALERLGARSGIPLAETAFARLHGALRAVEKAERASVVLVVQEGLSVAEAVRVQGGTRIQFQRRLAEGMAALGDDLIDELLGRVGRSPRS